MQTITYILMALLAVAAVGAAWLQYRRDAVARRRNSVAPKPVARTEAATEEAAITAPKDAARKPAPTRKPPSRTHKAARKHDKRERRRKS
ncbi:MAG TPA: hypothetical protein VFQ88_05840 [Nevskiaceae bacterium]|nr:hypothetical protein [Nevskiaceae bacterium]